MTKRTSKKIGIYHILNKQTSEFYIGQSNSIYNRWDSHREVLRNNNHTNNLLQDNWNEYGESSFDFDILSTIPIKDPDKLLEKETYYLNHYITLFGEHRCLSLEKNPVRVTGKAQSFNKGDIYYLYNPFGEFVNSFTNARKVCEVLNLESMATFYKIVNNYKDFKSYKGYSVKKEFQDKLEPYEFTYAILKNGELWSRVETQKDLRTVLNIKGGGHLDFAIKARVYKKEYQIIPYSEYIKNNYRVEEFVENQKHAVNILDVKTKKVLKSFESIAEALRFLEYGHAIGKGIKDAIAGNYVYLNYLWNYEN